MIARLAARLVLAWVATLGAWLLVGTTQAEHVERGILACALSFAAVVTARSNRSALVRLAVVLALAGTYRFVSAALAAQTEFDAAGGAAGVQRATKE